MRPLALAVGLLVAGPAAAQPAQLSAEAIKKIKATTVFIKVKVPGGLTTGSGFLVKVDGKTGFVATNDHVVAPSTGKSRADRGQPMPVQGIQVVFQSGTPQELRIPGVVVARDPERDLACVRFPIPKGVDLPEPMSPAGVKATETMPVYVCGFPFGGQLAEGEKNPEISIGPASVSSVRSDERGEIQRVQINGALNPGNSGGPVVDAGGRLVGVAVTTIVGAGLGFAVPQHMVKQMMDGRVSEPVMLRSSNGAAVAVSLVVDPLNKVKLDKVWVGPVTDPNKKSLVSVSELPKAFSKPVQGQPVNAVNGAFKIAYAEFPLAPNVAEAWVQSAWKDTDGNSKKGLAHRARFRNVAGSGIPSGQGMPPGGDDDDDSPGGSLPKEFFDGIPGVPNAPGGPFAGPGAPGGRGKPARPNTPDADSLGPRANPGQPRPPAPAVPFGGPMGRPGKPGPQGGPDSQPSPGGPQSGDSDAASLKLLDRIAADPGRTVGGRFKLWVLSTGVEPSGRLTAFRPDGTPLVGLRLQMDANMAEQVRGEFTRRNGGRYKVIANFNVTGYDAAEFVAVGQLRAVEFDHLPTDDVAQELVQPPPAEQEDSRSTPAPPTQQPALSPPPSDLVRPPVAADEGGVSTGTIVLAVVLMLAAVVGVVGVGAAVMYAGQSGGKKTKPKRRPARHWDDDEDDDFDDRPRRRRR